MSILNKKIEMSNGSVRLLATIAVGLVFSYASFFSFEGMLSFIFLPDSFVASIRWYVLLGFVLLNLVYIINCIFIIIIRPSERQLKLSTLLYIIFAVILIVIFKILGHYI